MKHRFVEFIPDHLESDCLYISIQFSTAVHKCVCGCGNEVVTPISPTDWSFTFNGETITLYPSIGNWSFKCKSHYWIRKGEVIYCRRWDTSEIEENRTQDKKQKKWYFKKKK